MRAAGSDAELPRDHGHRNDRALCEPFVDASKRNLGARERLNEGAPVKIGKEVLGACHVGGSPASLVSLAPACSRCAGVAAMRRRVAASLSRQRGPRAAASS